jgi:hypothetical protein
MLERRREQVPEANLGFGRSGLALYTFGQCQWHLGRARVGGYQTQQRSLRAGETRAFHPRPLEWEDDSGQFRPSSDLPTHRVLYNAFAEIGVGAHRHSLYATAWGRRRRPTPGFGTTHATISIVRLGSLRRRDWLVFLRSTTWVAGSACSLVPGNKHLLFSVRARTTSIEV